jgi:hypothetical protein
MVKFLNKNNEHLQPINPRKEGFFLHTPIHTFTATKNQTNLKVYHYKSKKKTHLSKKWKLKNNEKIFSTLP